MNRMDGPPPIPPDPYANETAAERREREIIERANSYGNCDTPTSRQRGGEEKKRNTREAAMLERSASLSPSSPPAPKAPKVSQDDWADRAMQFSECTTPTSVRKREEEKKNAAREKAMADRAMAL